MKMRGDNRPMGYWPLDRDHRENAPKPLRSFVVQLWHGDMSYHGEGRRKMVIHWEVEAESENAAIAVIGSQYRDEILALIPHFGHEIAVDNAKWIVDRKEDFRV